MKVGILGSGIVGKTLAAGFLKHGHEVTLGTRSPGSDEAQKWVSETPGAKVGTFAEAAQFGELLVMAVSGDIVESVIDLAGKENFSGKILIDPTNPISGGPVDGVLPMFTGPNESLAEKIQSLLPTAKVVKAFNSVGAARMIDPQFEQGQPTMFFCGNDADAKKTVSDILVAFGWEPLDCGPLAAARGLEPLSIVWCIPGFRNNMWTHAFKVLTH